MTKHIESDTPTINIARELIESRDARSTTLTSGETMLKVIYHPLYRMNKFVTNKSKLPQDGAQLFPYMG